MTRNAALLLTLASALCAQQPAVIKTETRMVLVDAVVTDKSGNYIKDLTAKDFHLWEDNKEQTIQSVTRESDAAASGQPSYTVLFFNNALLDNSTQFRARQAAMQYVQSKAGPKNLFAVADYSIGLKLTQNFTDDVSRLAQAVQGVQSGDAINDVANAPTPPRNSLNSSNLPTPTEDSERRLIQAIQLLARNLGIVPGRKTIVLFSQGMPHDNTLTPALNNAINMCNRENVSVYPVAGASLVAPVSAASAAPAPRSSATGRPGATTKGGLADVTSNMDTSTNDSFTDQLLHMLARGTGGYVNQNTNDFLAMLTKVVQEEGEYYLIGYAPSESPEGSCHSLRVKVDRGGTDLRTRTTYCNVKAVDLLAGKPVERDLENRVAGSEAGTIAASMQLPFFYSDPGVARLNVTMEMPSSAFKFEKVKGKFHAAVDVLGIAYASADKIAARFSDTVEYDFANQKEVDAFHAKPVHYEKQFSIAPGKYTFKVVFRAGEAFGKLEAPLSIDPYDGKQFMISALTLSKEMHPATELGTSLDSELLEGRTPLVFRDLRVVPAAGNQFQGTDQAALYLELYDPLALTKDAPALGVQLKVVDKKSGEVKSTGAARIEAPQVAGNAMVPYGLRIKLDGLQPGMYTAQVLAGDSAGKSMTRSVDFEVR